MTLFDTKKEIPININLLKEFLMDVLYHKKLEIARN